MKQATLNKLTSFAVVSALVIVFAAAPAEAGWQDNSGDLDFGRKDNTLVVAGGAVAVGVGIWALVRHSKKKKMRRMEAEIAARRAELQRVAVVEAPSAEEPEAGQPSLDEVLQSMAIERLNGMRAMTTD